MEREMEEMKDLERESRTLIIAELHFTDSHHFYFSSTVIGYFTKKEMSFSLPLNVLHLLLLAEFQQGFDSK